MTVFKNDNAEAPSGLTPHFVGPVTKLCYTAVALTKDPFFRAISSASVRRCIARLFELSNFAVVNGDAKAI
jgi:hypothetical protein